jgi:hypothetical protein
MEYNACGNCKNFLRIGKTAHGKCAIKKFHKMKSGKETNLQFITFQSSKACKQFEKGV